ncbi:MAG: NADH-quinone oxidoreductase subunit L, partial [Proteobacteria bacterium]|nr:NADH-quinone oxidoreductase subunit L [Pseudomonadota bacterium]
MIMQIILAILLLSPLVGSLLNGLIIRSPSARLSGTIATVAALVSFLCAIVLTSSVMSGNIVEMSWLWFGAGSFKANWGFRFDQLTSVMALVVTGIGTLIH